MVARRQSGPHEKLSPQRHANGHAENTKGLYTRSQYPDGGDTPFGGQLIYSGSHDDDGGWSLLRLRKTETVSAPYTDVSAEEVDFETRLRLEQERVRPFFMVDKAKQIPDDSTSLQLQLADKYFQTYLNKKPPVLFVPRPRPDRSRRRRQGQSDLRRAPGFLSWRPNRGHRTPGHTAQKPFSPTAHTRSILARLWPAKQGPPRFHANRHLARLALARSPGQTPIMTDEPG